MIEDMPDEILVDIAAHLVEPSKLSIFSRVNKRYKKCTEAQMLLCCVMGGQQDMAEKMIVSNPSLLEEKRRGREWHNGREFKSITPFQYALWALDWYMWDMMMKYIDHSSARSQLEELEKQGTEHGKQFDGFDKLINAYSVYVCGYSLMNDCERIKYWCEELGGSQKALPLHALQEYYRKDRKMDPTPDFKGKRGTSHENLVEQLSKKNGLGGEFALCRGENLRARMDEGWWGVAFVEFGVDIDRKGIVSLKNTRETQYKELRETLSKAPVLSIR